jgi:hypothetical protein
MAQFYDRDGRLYFKAAAGGLGGGATAEWDGPATEDQIKDYSLEYAAYLKSKKQETKHGSV